MLTELEPVPAAVLPIPALRDHLRLGTGFADDALQDAILEAALRGALGAIEGRLGRILIARPFASRVMRWRDAAAWVLPAGPATRLISLVIEDAEGAPADVTARVVLRESSGGPPAIEGHGGALPAIPPGGAATATFTAGFGPWDALPADLRQAALMLAASYYEDRAAASRVAFPPLVSALLAPWRVLRLSAGGPR